jgi:hypothetical protein
VPLPQAHCTSIEETDDPIASASLVACRVVLADYL